MRPNRRFAVLVLAIIAGIGLIIVSPWDSGEEHNKATLLGQVSATLEEHHAPPQLTRCFVGALEKNLTEDEVQSAYDAVPNGADGTSSEIANFGPALKGKVARYGLLCLQRLVQSGKYTQQEMAQLLRRMALQEGSQG